MICLLCAKPARGPWCSPCSQEQMKERISLAEEALEAFWRTVAQRLPDDTPGDLGVGTTRRLNQAARDAVLEWFENNAPLAVLGQCPHGLDDAGCKGSCSHYAHGSGDCCTQCDERSYPDAGGL